MVNFNIRNQYNGDTATGILAGKIGNGVIIENVHTENCYVYGYGSTGGLVGENTDIEAQNIVGGYILNCGLYNTHTIYLGESGALVTNCSPTGGFIGKLYSSSQMTISNSFAMNENINGGNENTLAIGNNQIGGFIGVVDENAIVNVTNCFSYGSIRSESSTIIMGNKDSFGGFIGINYSSQTSISNCYAYVVLDYDSGWLFDYITPRAFGHNSGNGNFNNNYALSQNLENSSGADYDLQDSSFHSQNSFSFDFENSWSMGSVNNVSNIPLPNQASISILTDNNSTIVITKDGIEIERQTGSELNLTSLSYGNYNVEIYRYAQTTPTSHSFSLSIDDKSYYVFDKSFYGGSGLETSPYQITHIDNFGNLNNFGNSYFILENNINFNQQILSPCENFGGILNGNNKSVLNFSIDSTQNNVGLFSTLNNAHIQNLNIFTFKINSLNSLNTGVIAGETIGSQVENIKIYYGSIISNSGNVGGIAGNISGTTIFNAQVDISIESTSINGYTGGVVGTANNSSTISQSFSSGDISAFNNVGGFIGNAQDVLIENSYTTTNVTGTTNDASTSVIGGFAGNIEQNSTIKTSFMYGAVKSQNSIANVGVFAGKNNSIFLENIYAWNINNFHIIFNDQVSQNGVTFITTDEFYSQTSFVNFDFNTIWTLENTNYPKFINQV